MGLSFSRILRSGEASNTTKPQVETVDPKLMTELYRSVDAAHTPLVTLGFTDADTPTAAEIKAAYKSLALLLHPDKCEASQTGLHSRLFIKVQDAYEDLAKKIENGEALTGGVKKPAAPKPKALGETEGMLHARNVWFKDALREAREKAIKEKHDAEEREAAKLRRQQEYEEEVAAKEVERREYLRILVVDFETAIENSKTLKKELKDSSATKAERLVEKREAAKIAHIEHEKIWTPEAKAEVKAQRRAVQLEHEAQAKPLWNQRHTNQVECLEEEGLDDIREQQHRAWNRDLLSGAPTSVSLVEHKKKIECGAFQDLKHEIQSEREEGRRVDAALRATGLSSGNDLGCYSEREAFTEGVREEMAEEEEIREQGRLADLNPVEQALEYGGEVTATTSAWEVKYKASLEQARDPAVPKTIDWWED